MLGWRTRALCSPGAGRSLLEHWKTRLLWHCRGRKQAVKNLLNPRSSGQPHPSQKVARHRGCRLTLCPSSSLLEPHSLCDGQGGKRAWWPRDSCACWVSVSRTKPCGFTHMLHPSTHGGEAQLRTLCQAAVSPKAKTAQGPSLMREQCDGNVPTPLLSSRRAFTVQCPR